MKSIYGIILFALFSSPAAHASQNGAFVCTVEKSISSWIKAGQSVTIDVSEAKLSSDGKYYKFPDGIVSRAFSQGFDSITLERSTGIFIDQDSEQSSPQNGKIIATGHCKST